MNCLTILKRLKIKDLMNCLIILFDMIRVQTRVALNTRILNVERIVSFKLARLWLTMSKPIVLVKQGKLEGAVLKSALGLSYIGFKGIPFAAPPIGSLRFKVHFRQLSLSCLYFITTR